jgi:hypothetical protein
MCFLNSSNPIFVHPSRSVLQFEQFHLHELQTVACLPACLFLPTFTRNSVTARGVKLLNASRHVSDIQASRKHLAVAVLGTEMWACSCEQPLDKQASVIVCVLCWTSPVDMSALVLNPVVCGFLQSLHTFLQAWNVNFSHYCF